MAVPPEYTSSPAASNPGGVLNVQPSGEYLAGTDIIDQLINPASQVQSVTYHFKGPHTR
ncbi:MAG: hypothetical protein U0T82_05740 [Bacteroidales bacterium]